MGEKEAIRGIINNLEKTKMERWYVPSWSFSVDDLKLILEIMEGVKAKGGRNISSLEVISLALKALNFQLKNDGMNDLRISLSGIEGYLKAKFENKGKEK